VDPGKGSKTKKWGVSSISPQAQTGRTTIFLKTDVRLDCCSELEVAVIVVAAADNG